MKMLLAIVFSAWAFPVFAFVVLWTPATGVVTGYIIEESIDNGQTWTTNQELQDPQPNADGFIEATIAEPSALTIYRVKAVNDGGQSLLEHSLVGRNPVASGTPPVWGSDSTMGSGP